MTLDGDTFMINNAGKDIIELFDGSHSYENVIQILSDKYNDKRDNVANIVEDFIDELSQRGIFLQETNHVNKIEILGAVDYFPDVASVELTNACNLRCIHCYGEFGIKHNNMPLQNASKILTDLSENGVRVVELTGGDISVYPWLLPLLRYAITLNFDKIDLLTNGFVLDDNIIDFVIKNKDRFALQIDIHSLNNDYLKWFTGVNVDVEKLLRTIERFATSGVSLKIATIVTRKNLDELWKIADYIREHNLTWGISPVEPIGRADFKTANNDLYLNYEESIQLYEMIYKIKEETPGIVDDLKEEERVNEYNCGVLTNHVVINCNGNIKLCTMDNMEYGWNSIGNLNDKGLREIYNENIDLIKAMITQEVPNGNSEECRNCEKFRECYGCMLRTFLNARRLGDKCKWYKRHIDSIILKRTGLA